MGVDGDGGEPVGRRDIGQMLAEGFLIDAQVLGEGQQDGRDDTVGQVMGMTGHFGAPRERGVVVPQR